MENPDTLNSSQFLQRLDRFLVWVIHPFRPKPAHILFYFLIATTIIEEVWKSRIDLIQVWGFVTPFSEAFSNPLALLVPLSILAAYGFLFVQVVRFIFKKRLAWMTIAFMNYYRLLADGVTIIYFVRNIFSGKHYEPWILFWYAVGNILWTLFHLWKMRAMNSRRILAMYKVKRTHHLIALIAGLALSLLMIVSWFLATMDMR